jgi:DNA-3-methyladenine glycosylase I
MNRCWWCEGDPLYEDYHDTFWGKPQHDEQILFEFLSLELFQSGLSWITILRKQENFHEAFAGWDIAAIASFGDEDKERLLADRGIVRNRKKIEAVIQNARAYPALVEEFGSLDAFLWSFQPPPEATPRGGFTRENMPLLLDEAKSMSKALKKRGFSFTGPMVCTSLMQAAGIVNHHVAGCDLAPV